LGTSHNSAFTERAPEADIDGPHELLDAAYDLGINFFDAANVYGKPDIGASERVIGEWLANHDREEIILASKVGIQIGNGPNEGGLSRKHVTTQLNRTLDRLATSYLDIYYLHRWDDETPITETLSTLADAVRQGKIHHIGLSMTAAWKLTKALSTSELHDWPSITVTQPRFNAANREEVNDYLDVCAEQKLAVCPYAPLEGGFLTGKYERQGTTPSKTRGEEKDWDTKFETRQWRVLDAVSSVAEELGVLNVQVALQWLMAQERFETIPVMGVRNADQLEQNVQAVNVSLSTDQLHRITEAYYRPDED
jgi:aryl-alcohol dehydrogenase-like predicted oxidoreductase